MNGLNAETASPGRWMAIGLIALGLILGSPLSANADWKTTSWIGFEGQGDTNLKSDKIDFGEFSFWDLGMGVKISNKLNDSFAVAIQGDYRAVGYDFSNVPGGKDPWGTVHVFRLNPMVTFILNDSWSLTAGPSFQISGEAGAKVRDSVMGGGTFGVGYKWSDDLSIALGVVITSQIEDDAWVQPFVLINWGITDNLSLAMEGTSSRGGEVNLMYALGDHWELGIGIGFRRERFRLDDRGFAGAADGVGEEEATVINVRVSYKMSDHLSLEGYGGTTMDGEFRIETKNGVRIGKSDYDNGGYGGIRLKVGF